MDMMLWIQLKRQPLLLADHHVRQTLEDGCCTYCYRESRWWRVLTAGVMVNEIRNLKIGGRVMGFRLSDTHCHLFEGLPLSCFA